MEDKTKLFELLLEKVANYGKTSIELGKLKVIDKTADMGSSFITQSVILVIILSFLLFINLGLAFWLGELLGKIYYGFFVIASFYVIIGIFLHFFIYKWLNMIICNFIIKQMLK